MLLPTIALACLAFAAPAQAQIKILRVVNAASYQTGIPEPGSLATIYCTGLAQVSGIVLPATQSPLPLQLGAVAVTVNLSAAPLLAVASLGDGMYQINFQVPPERLLARMAAIRILNNGSFAEMNGLDYPATGGLFDDGQGGAIAMHAADGSRVTQQNPARPGESIAVYGTGLGQTYPPKPVGYPTPSSPTFQGPMNYIMSSSGFSVAQQARQLSLGGRSVHVSFAGLAPALAGVDQIVFDVPAGLSPGPHSLALIDGVISCQPPPFAQGCSFQANAASNPVSIQVQ
jgi:uncharacterized protein (TIGR03437 family)